MKIKEPKNPNYVGQVVEIKTIVPLANRDRVVHAIIMGNKVITDVSTQVGDVGIYFPVETALSKEYLSVNNLYSHSELNADQTKKGYFEKSGRIRCQKFGGHPSEGLFMPMNSLSGLGIDISDLSIGDIFDELNNVPICAKYVIKKSQSQGLGNNPKSRNPKVSKLIDNQFKFHLDTAQLFRNTHRVFPNSLISISYKVHGTSSIASNLLCKKPLKWYEKFLKKIGVDVNVTHYDSIWASRKVVKNENLYNDANSFYKEDIWGIANKELSEYLQEGMTFYFEIVGYLPSGGAIQSCKLGAFDYGCEPDKHENYIYRIKYTNVKGKDFEFSAKQVQDFCSENGLNAVPQLYYGFAKDFYDEQVSVKSESEYSHFELLSKVNLEKWQEGFLNAVKEKYNEKDCYMCKTPKLPEEGVVVRIEGINCEVYKCKSRRFLEMETLDLDSGKIDIESDESE